MGFVYAGKTTEIQGNGYHKISVSLFYFLNALQVIIAEIPRWHGVSHIVEPAQDVLNGLHTFILAIFFLDDIKRPGDKH